MIVVVVTLVTFGFGVYGVLNIKLDFDSLWFMDTKSYQSHYFKSLHKNFPEHGERVEVYTGKYKIPNWSFQEWYLVATIL